MSTENRRFRASSPPTSTMFVAQGVHDMQRKAGMRHSSAGSSPRRHSATSSTATLVSPTTPHARVAGAIGYSPTRGVVNGALADAQFAHEQRRSRERAGVKMQALRQEHKNFVDNLLLKHDHAPEHRSPTQATKKLQRSTHTHVTAAVNSPKMHHRATVGHGSYGVGTANVVATGAYGQVLTKGMNFVTGHASSPAHSPQTRHTSSSQIRTASQHAQDRYQTVHTDHRMHDLRGSRSVVDLRRGSPASTNRFTEGNTAFKPTAIEEMIRNSEKSPLAPVFTRSLVGESKKQLFHEMIMGCGYGDPLADSTMRNTSPLRDTASATPIHLRRSSSPPTTVLKLLICRSDFKYFLSQSVMKLFTVRDETNVSLAFILKSQIISLMNSFSIFLRGAHSLFNEHHRTAMHNSRRR